MPISFGIVVTLEQPSNRLLIVLHDSDGTDLLKVDSPLARQELGKSLGMVGEIILGSLADYLTGRQNN